MKKQVKSNVKKQLLLDALEASLGIVSIACKHAGVSRSTYYEYYNSDIEFAKKVDDQINIALDFAESQLFKLIKKGNTQAIMFYLKTKGKKRGYTEKTEPELTSSQVNPVTIYLPDNGRN